MISRIFNWAWFRRKLKPWKIHNFTIRIREISKNLLLLIFPIYECSRLPNSTSLLSTQCPETDVKNDIGCDDYCILPPCLIFYIVYVSSFDTRISFHDMKKWIFFKLNAVIIFYGTFF